MAAIEKVNRRKGAKPRRAPFGPARYSRETGDGEVICYRLSER